MIVRKREGSANFSAQISHLRRCFALIIAPANILSGIKFGNFPILFLRDSIRLCAEYPLCLIGRRLLSTCFLFAYF
jgi:hypothetical protein